MRLDKYITLTGVTRKQARAVITAGRVTVSGSICRDIGANVSMEDDIALDGASLGAKSELYIMVNKPAGMLTATEDAHGQPTVVDLLPENLRRREPGPIGRLDKDVTGLVILTTNGQVTHKIISPKQHVEKVYLARVEGTPDEADIKRFTAGIPLKDFTAMPAKLSVIEPGEQALCEVRIMEGKFHQVKRMLGAIEHPVLSLSRISIAGITLDPNLAEGEWRELTADEEQKLLEAAGMDKKSDMAESTDKNLLEDVWKIY